ncbi:MAG: 3-oxoacyl-ACP reductase FabG [Thermoleophilia bacterium]|nr:3-oxoacyl-ACP reductase FabG [Thermoleophilia bacterium]
MTAPTQRLLDGKVAVVTGSSKGIGRGLAVGLASHGATVVVNYKNDRDGAEATAEAIRDISGEAIVIGADIGSSSEAIRLVDEAVEQLGRLDVLVNNAGRSRFNWALEMTDEDFDDVVDTNLRGTFFTSQAAARHMRDAGGSIINVSSCAATLTAIYHSIYTMSKAAIEGLTKQLALEWAPTVRVNAIAPGPTSVERSRDYDPNFDETWGSVVPLGRVAYPDDLVGPVAFLASDLSRYVTGAVLHVDGGWTVQGKTPAMDDFDVSADQKRG